MYPTKDIHILGYAYGYIARHLEIKGNQVLKSPINFEMACAQPNVGLAIAHRQLIICHELTDGIQAQLGQLLAQVTYSPDAPDERLSLQEQGIWQQGYYRALSGNPMLTDDELTKGIRAARKSKGLTQSQLGEKMGCTQVEISRWETGQAKPSSEVLERMAQALECSVDRLIETK